MIEATTTGKVMETEEKGGSLWTKIDSFLELIIFTDFV